MEKYIITNFFKKIWNDEVKSNAFIYWTSLKWDDLIDLYLWDELTGLSKVKNNIFLINRIKEIRLITLRRETMNFCVIYLLH